LGIIKRQGWHKLAALTGVSDKKDEVYIAAALRGELDVIARQRGAQPTCPVLASIDCEKVFYDRAKVFLGAEHRASHYTTTGFFPASLKRRS